MIHFVLASLKTFCVFPRLVVQLKGVRILLNTDLVSVAVVVVLKV